MVEWVRTCCSVWRLTENVTQAITALERFATFEPCRIPAFVERSH
jgi:hypothetical protein